jgi:hypothetical protein
MLFFVTLVLATPHFLVYGCIGILFFCINILTMNTMAAKFAALIAKASDMERRLELFVILLINTKPFATLQSIIISMAN